MCTVPYTLDQIPLELESLSDNVPFLSCEFRCGSMALSGASYYVHGCIAGVVRSSHSDHICRIQNRIWYIYTNLYIILYLVSRIWVAAIKILSLRILSTTASTPKAGVTCRSPRCNVLYVWSKRIETACSAKPVWSHKVTVFLWACACTPEQAKSFNENGHTCLRNRARGFANKNTYTLVQAWSL